ncbi:hypothetical protein GSI_07235 [Ganoderma sinense ZZ0214-1]|uniref:SPIN90/Ldb17 leucine-rich domain-containing protein n=1 Tax=Ganoderma sinense ZZ0214-1 TaxID=1077348 RepID=A0A2G8S9U6_9APHY|nr:hypothetical protein GSI_07235 [Ganoderma sinense ZZ0214-1]
MPAPPMDVFGIVYIIENAPQFWSELEEILHIPDDTTLSKLDATLRRCISFCAAYHEQYLQSPLQLEHACSMILASELFSFHSERMCELMVGDAKTNTDPHYEMMLYNVMLAYGRRSAVFLRSQKRWQPLLPLLMDHVRNDLDPEVDDAYYGVASGSTISATRGVAVPIEAKLRSLSVRLLYEVCRMQKLSLQDLRIFDDGFIGYLYDLVEQTREIQDETFNYSVIKLILALNEQFMVASVQAHTSQPHGIDGGLEQPQADPRNPEDTNRILRILMSRAGSSPTFGENLIFMLNRADCTTEDLCMQLLVLKLLYLLFTTKAMAEYFYTNDLCVLVDVFLREINNMDEDNESLRHTYLRVLHPLLTKTQLRNMPYKRPQIVRTLESLIENEKIRDVDPTTKRLVHRCMNGEWCVQFRKGPITPVQQYESRKMSIFEEDVRRKSSPGLDAVSAAAPQSAGVLSGPGFGGPGAPLGRKESVRGKHGKATRSAEHLPLPNGNVPKQRAVSSHHNHQPHHHHTSEQLSSHARKDSDSVPAVRQFSGDSMTSLPRVATAAPATTSSAVGKHRVRAGSFNVEATTTSFAALSTQDSRTRPPRMLDTSGPLVTEPSGSLSAPPEIRVLSPTSPVLTFPRDGTRSASPGSPTSSITSSSSRSTTRRAAPPPPVKTRRAPPAPPARKGKLSPVKVGSPLSAIAASSHPNLPALGTG